MADRFTTDEMLDKAGRALGRIEARGRRGTEMIPWDEIEAMACTLRCLGMQPILPGHPYPGPAGIFIPPLETGEPK